MEINEVKKIREQFGYTHIVILGISADGSQNVATHGKTAVHARQAANMGNHLKK